MKNYPKTMIAPSVLQVNSTCRRQTSFVNTSMLVPRSVIKGLLFHSNIQRKMPLKKETIMVDFKWYVIFGCGL